MERHRRSVAGAVCVLDQAYPWGSAGNAFTGVVFTKRMIDPPEVYGTRTRIDLEVCLWVLAPQSTPTDCMPPIGVTGEAPTTPAVGNLGELIPATTGATFSTYTSTAASAGHDVFGRASPLTEIRRWAAVDGAGVPNPDSTEAGPPPWTGFCVGEGRLSCGRAAPSTHA